MRYIISQSQFHKLVYQYLDDLFSKDNFKKEINPFVSDGNTWRIDMYSDLNKNLISYFWYGPGGSWDDDEGTIHNGVGNLHIHPSIIDTIRGLFRIRESKVMDIVADWVSEKLNVDIDEISIYPQRKSSPNY
jgi:hypothetical protein